MIFYGYQTPRPEMILMQLTSNIGQSLLSGIVGVYQKPLECNWPNSRLRPAYVFSRPPLQAGLYAIKHTKSHAVNLVIGALHVLNLIALVITHNRLGKKFRFVLIAHIETDADGDVLTIWARNKRDLRAFLDLEDDVLVVLRRHDPKIAWRVKYAIRAE
jgi:hypothetical protein